ADEELHLGGLVPGDHARADGSRRQRQGRHAGRPQGERDRRPAHPGGHGRYAAPPAQGGRQARRAHRQGEGQVRGREGAGGTGRGRRPAPARAPPPAHRGRRGVAAARAPRTPSPLVRSEGVAAFAAGGGGTRGRFEPPSLAAGGGGRQNMPRASLASSDMRSLSHGGSKVSVTVTWPTPGTAPTAFSTQVGISPATGQPGAVSVISIATLRSSSTSIL